jgi:hypothetical protein
MRRTRTLFAVLLTCALLVNLIPLFAAPSGAAQQSPAIGDAIPVANQDGTAVGSITVTEITDPFTDFNPDYPPEDGSRYVVASVAFDSDAGQRFDIAPYTIVLQDDAGFLWNQSSLTLPDEALVPELSNQTLAPGSRVTGLVGFVVPNDRAPARVFYQPESSRVVPLAELTSTPAPTMGQAVALPDSKGDVGSVTVTDVADPFEDVDPSSTPPDGNRIVLVTLVYENTSDGQFFIEPYGLLMQDANGNLWNSTSVTRPDQSKVIPDITSAQLAPGDRLSGAVVFAVPVGVALSGVYASPMSAQFLELADLQGAMAGATKQPSTGVVATPTEEESASAATSGPCGALEQWLATTRERIQRATEMSVEDAKLDDPESLAAHGDEYAALAKDQLAEVPPAEAVAANKALAATFNAYSSAIHQILTANDPDKDTTLEVTEGMNTFNEAGDRMHSIEDELTRVAGGCGLT